MSSKPSPIIEPPNILYYLGNKINATENPVLSITHSHKLTTQITALGNEIKVTHNFNSQNGHFENVFSCLVLLFFNA